MAITRKTSVSTVTALLAGAMTLATGSASALIIDNMNGIDTISPYYISQSQIATTFEGGGDSQFSIQEADFYSSNFAPQATTAIASIEQNGATINGTTWSVANGFFSSSSYASLQITNAQAGDGYYASAGTGSHTQVQFFTAEAAAARSVFTWNVTGSEVEPYGRADARMDFLAGSYEYDGASYYDVYNTGETWFGPGTRSYTINAPLDTPIDLFFWSSAFVQLNRGEVPQGANVTVTADYGSTFELSSIDLYDEFDNLITDWWMIDLYSGETVFTAAGRTDGTSVSVPEPATLALLGLGLLGLGVTRRRRAAA